MKITGYSLPTVKHPQVDVPIHPHQAAMIDAWNHYDSFLLVTKTGSGKTAATVLPVALNRTNQDDNRVLFVYPTNELIRDQERSMLEWLRERLKLKVCLISPDSPYTIGDDAEIEILRIDAQILEKFCERWQLRTLKGRPDKGRALERLFNSSKAKIVLINPDILYLIYAMRYGKAQNSIAALQAFQTIVFDEFHLYQGVELAHILYLIHAARELGAFKRVVLLSATPHPDVRTWIDRLLDPHEITMETTTDHAICATRTVAHDIELEMLRATREQAVNVAYAKVMELLSQLRGLRLTHPADAKYVPCVIIVNSVVKAIELEQKLLNAGIAKEHIVPIRGMSARAVRKLHADMLIVIGTSAIEVGIDFQCDYLIFEAGDAAAFMQRFGRLGRHAPGQAFLIASDRECRVLESSPILTRSELEEIVARSYPEADAKAWFVNTELGAFAAIAQTFCILNQVDRDRDDGPDADMIKHQINDSLTAIMNRYGDKMGVAKQVKEAQRWYRKSIEGKGWKWIGDYLKLDTFRAGLPNRRVHDYSEERRRGKEFAEYDLDIATILEKASNPQRKGEMIYIDDLTEKHTVKIAQSFHDGLAQPNALLTTEDFPNVMITRDGKLEDASSEMSRRGVSHIFVFVPKDIVKDVLGWRMKWFYCRDYQHVLAFDHDALLLKELFKRQQK